MAYGSVMGLVAEIDREIRTQDRSRAEVARAAGIHEVQVRNMFRKGQPLPAGRNAEKLADALDCEWKLVPKTEAAVASGPASPEGRKR